MTECVFFVCTIPLRLAVNELFSALLHFGHTSSPLINRDALTSYSFFVPCSQIWPPAHPYPNTPHPRSRTTATCSNASRPRAVSESRSSPRKHSECCSVSWSTALYALSTLTMSLYTDFKAESELLTVLSLSFFFISSGPGLRGRSHNSCAQIETRSISFPRAALRSAWSAFPNRSCPHKSSTTSRTRAPPVSRPNPSRESLEEPACFPSSPQAPPPPPVCQRVRHAPQPASSNCVRIPCTSQQPKMI